MDSEPGAAASGPISHAIFRLARTHRALAGRLFRELGLRPGQELLLMHLWEHGPQRQADLAALVDTDSASMTRTVQRLERAGFVRRRPSPVDGRVTLVEPTAASLALRPRIEALWASLEQATVGDLDRDEQAASLQNLRRLEQNLLDPQSPGAQP
ncbi:transcriptional regulator [Cellulomonas sp. Leaf395]|jgi:DNA-binding MarR family transcriptional regulator|nr:transcriptional regulator [Cellulomonas sp. Leaf395]